MKRLTNQVDSVRFGRSRQWDDAGLGARVLSVDNVTSNPGTGGASFATDDISGTHWPFTKMAWGPRDTANEVAAAAGKGVPMQGEAAHAAASTGNPVLMGLEAKSANGTPVADGQAVRGRADTLGKVIVLQGGSHEAHVMGTVNLTTTTAADVLGAQAAGVRLVVTSIVVTNAHATVGTKVSLRDGVVVKHVGYAAPAGGGFTLSAGGRPILLSTAATAISAVCGTTGADVDVSMSGYIISN